MILNEEQMVDIKKLIDELDDAIDSLNEIDGSDDPDSIEISIKSTSRQIMSVRNQLKSIPKD